MADEAEVALVAALAKGLGANEVGVGQVAVIDDVGVAAGGGRGSEFSSCINLLFFSNTYKKVRVLTKGK